MKRILILCLSLLCLLAACQPTPERPFVIQNDQEKMLETAQKVEGPQTEAEATQPDTVDFMSDWAHPGSSKRSCPAPVGGCRWRWTRR